MTEGRAANGVPPPPGGPAGGGRKKRGCLVRLVTGALVFTCLLTITLAGWAWYIHGRHASLAAEVEVLLAEYRADRPHVSEEENAAPLYRQAFQAHSAGEGDEGLPDYEPERGPDYYLGAAVTRYATANGKHLSLLEQAVARPTCDFRVDVTKGSLCEYDFALGGAGKGGLAGSARFVAIMARKIAAAGDADKALDLLAMNLRMARDAGREPGYMPYLAQLACECDRFAGPVVDVLNQASPRKESVEDLLWRVESHLSQRKPAMHAIRTERMLELITALNLAAGSDLKAVAEGSERSAAANPRGSGPSLFGYSLIPYRDADLISKYYNEAATGLESPYPTAFDEVRERLSKLPDPSNLGRLRMVANVSLAGIRPVANGEATALACLHLARLAMGCRLFDYKHGCMPENLETMAKDFPQHFRELPADPYSAKPFIYRKTAQGCLIYSIGDDRRDSGGKGSPYPDIVVELKVAERVKQ